MEERISLLSDMNDQLQRQLQQSEDKFNAMNEEQEDLLLCMAEMDMKISVMAEKLAEFGVTEESLFPSSNI